MNKRIACYSCVTNGYDDINEIRYPEEDVHYFLFSDTFIEAPFPWKNVVIEFPGLSAQEINRTVKIRPHLIPDLMEFDSLVYLDGHVQIIGSVKKFVDDSNLKGTKGVYFFQHQTRNSILEETIACAWFGHAWIWTLVKQLVRYRWKGFKDDIGLFECGVILWNRSEQNSKFSELWWNEYKNGSKRDQIALPYVLWKTNLDFGSLGPNNIRGNSAFFVLRTHKTIFPLSKKIRRMINFPLWVFGLKRLRKKA